MSVHDMSSEGKARGVAVLDVETRKPWDSLGKHPGRRQQVQGSWDRTCWAEVPSCIQSLWGMMGLINGQVYLLRAVGRQRARVPPRGMGGNSRAGLHLLCPGTLLPGSGTEGQVCTDRQGWERTPTKPAWLDTEWVWKWTRKADGGRQERSLFSVWGPGAASWMWEWGIVWEGLEQEGELCK